MIGLAASYMSMVGGDVGINEMVRSFSCKGPVVVGHKDGRSMTVCKLNINPTWIVLTVLLFAHTTLKHKLDQHICSCMAAVLALFCLDIHYLYMHRQNSNTS